MSFKSNVGKPKVEPGPGQCESIDMHHPDCTCTSCEACLDVQCLERVVGVVTDSKVRVCSACAIQAEREDFEVEYLPEVRFVAVHPEMGVYLGSAMGLGFWSKGDPVGQDAAVTFPDRATADKIMASWDGGRPRGTVTWPIIPDLARERYASIAACVAAGLDGWEP